MPIYKIAVQVVIADAILVEDDTPEAAINQAIGIFKNSDPDTATYEYSGDVVEELIPAPKVTPRCWCGAEFDSMGLCPLRHEALTEDTK